MTFDVENGEYVAIMGESGSGKTMLLNILARLDKPTAGEVWLNGKSIVLLKMLRKNKNYYYQTKHFTSVSGMIYRMKQNAVGLANICILSTGVLLMISATVCLYVGREDILSIRYPREVSIQAENLDGLSREQSTQLENQVEQAIMQTLKEYNLTRTNEVEYLSISFMAQEQGDSHVVTNMEEEMDYSHLVGIVIMSLEDYAVNQGFQNIRHFTDDGFSGTNFNRPGFKEMIAEVEAGHVGTVIVKDMSRFGRNYLQVGFYTEMTFPNKGVRFIAINNSVDSSRPNDNDFTPFLNIMNEWYAKDTSNKIRTIFKSRMKDGKRCSGSIPYGYMRMPGDKQTLYVDEESAKVVRRIFEMTCEGIGATEIAKILSEEKVLIPAAYAKEYHPEDSRSVSYHDPYIWNATTVGSILDKQEYLGHTVLGKTICENFKTKKRRKARPEELMFFPNTHEAIIDQETWDMAQKMRKRQPRKMSGGKEPHRLSGLIFCADCGARMGSGC